MSSQNTSAGRMRAPQRQRGRERVAALLAAADACFVEKGYDGATMTEIAARAGAAIGSLYQFFPTKEALALALLDDHAEALYARMDELAAQPADGDAARLAAQLSSLLVEFRRSRPAFVALADAGGSLPPTHARKIRHELRSRLAALLRAHAPQLDEAAARTAAVVTLQWMKAAVALAFEPALRDREAALEQLGLALRLYLDAVLKG